MSKEWIGVDFDGTLATYYGWAAPDQLGEPVPAIQQLVREWLEAGEDVRIFTARGSLNEEDRKKAYPAMEEWCLRHLGKVLPITNIKDVGCKLIVDDRAVQCERNTGRILGNIQKVLEPIKSKKST